MPALTIEEAKTKRCLLVPFDATHACIATKCMAWRWEYFTIGHLKNGPDYNAGMGQARGYCGHAGKPE